MQWSVIMAMSVDRNSSGSSSRQVAAGSGDAGGAGAGAGADAGGRGGHVSCSICSERYVETDRIYGGSCGHVFHWQCLRRWWEQSNSCPICRSADKQFFQLYLNFEELQPRNLNPTERSSPQEDLTYEFQELLYEVELYRDEIDYLNRRIGNLLLDTEPLHSPPDNPFE